MKVLNAVEQEAFESPPAFNSDQRVTPPGGESAYSRRTTSGRGSLTAAPEAIRLPRRVAGEQGE